MADTTNSSDSGGKLGLTLSYRSPAHESFVITKTLDAPVGGDVESRTQFLKALRSAVLSAQDETNKELTARMEEDKAREGQGPSSGADDAKEEENYGEEVQEEE